MTNWESGRQGTGYLKYLLIAGYFCYLYLLKFPTRSYVPEHTDPVPGVRHIRLNIILRHANEGGEFKCEGKLLINWSRVKLFRPDIQKHSVSRVKKGERLVLSLGVVFPGSN